MDGFPRSCVDIGCSTASTDSTETSDIEGSANGVGTGIVFCFFNVCDGFNVVYVT
jgi:hypothetical protein